jgi:hypothetical protein
MGACEFWNKVKSTSASAAFREAVREAQYESGHGGYTGTIAEKRDFVMVPVPAGQDPLAYSQTEAAMAVVDDKWGPAGCIKVGEGEWVFFGWASS